MRPDAMTADFDPGMSANSHIYPLNQITLTTASNTVEVDGIQNWNENWGPSPYSERMSHWLVGSSQIAVTGAEGHPDSRYCIRQWVLCSLGLQHPPFLDHRWLCY